MKPRVLLSTGCALALLFSGATAWSTHAEGTDRAEPAEQVPAVETAESTAAGFLGIAVAEAPPIDLDSRSPVLVISHVQPDSPAERAGMRSGDTLLRLDDQRLVHPVQLTRLVQDMAPGSEATLHIARKGEPMQLVVTLGERPEQLAQPMRPAVPQIHIPGEFRILPMERDGDFGRADFDQMFREMEQRMQQLRRELDAAPQLQLDLEKMMPARGVQSRLEVADEDHVLTVTTTDGERHLKAVDKQGNVIFDGPITTQEQLDKVPAEVREKVPTSPHWPKHQPAKPVELKAA